MDTINRIIRVEFELAVPVAATEAEIQAWVTFELGFRHTLATANPLNGHDIEAIEQPVITDTRQRLFERKVIEIGTDGKRVAKFVSERIPVIEEEEGA